MMLTSGWNNTNDICLPLISTNTGDKSQRQREQEQQLHQQEQKQIHEQFAQETLHRSSSSDSTQSIDNAYSLEHLFIALRRRIKRIAQTYNVKAFHDTLSMCARLFKSYASYNLNTIDEFARHLNKNSRDNKKVITVIDQFRLQLAELRHCHSTFESELLVTTLAIDFHEDESEQQNATTTLPLSKGKFSPRSRLSKVRGRHARQATEFKAQLRKINEQIQILLHDEFYANMTILWDESEKYISTVISFHDHHMTYVLRLIPDIVLKFEYALQLCTKLFDLETTMLETYSQTSRYNDNNNNKNPDDKNGKNHTVTDHINMNNSDNNNNHFKTPAITTPVTTFTLTSRSDDHQKQKSNEVMVENNHEIKQSNRTMRKTSNFFSADVTSNSSSSSDVKQLYTDGSPFSVINHNQPLDIVNQYQDNPIFPPIFSSSIKPIIHKNDQTKLQILMEQLDQRLTDEEVYRKRLLHCAQQSSKKSEQLNRFPKKNMLTLVMANQPFVTEYQKGLYFRDHEVHKSVEDEINIALRETQHRIDWIHIVRQRAFQCFRR